jgi:hypothetical protein
MIGAIMGAVGGVAEMAGGLIGQRGRKKEQRAARGQYDERMAQFENLDTSNLAGNLSNPYEDATVNTQGADYLAQQQQQASANMMSNMSGAAGGSGIAALAQAMANQQGQQAQQASANIAQQEQANQKSFLGQEVSNQNALAQATYSGSERARGLEYEKTDSLRNEAAQRKSAADGAVNDARKAMIGGIGDIAGGVTEFALTPNEK